MRKDGRGSGRRRVTRVPMAIVVGVREVRLHARVHIGRRGLPQRRDHRYGPREPACGWSRAPVLVGGEYRQTRGELMQLRRRVPAHVPLGQQGWAERQCRGARCGLGRFGARFNTRCRLGRLGAHISRVCLWHGDRRNIGRCLRAWILTHILRSYVSWIGCDRRSARCELARARSFRRNRRYSVKTVYALGTGSRSDRTSRRRRRWWWLRLFFRRQPGQAEGRIKDNARPVPSVGADSSGPPYPGSWDVVLGLVLEAAVAIRGQEISVTWTQDDLEGCKVPGGAARGEQPLPQLLRYAVAV